MHQHRPFFIIIMEYRTVKFESSDEYIVKKSRFIGYACPVKNPDEALAFISKIKSKHWDATHNVYAYILKDSGIKRYSDDGEPQGTAGIPTLDVLEKENVTDVCVVVTRYFGGILLGGGGLVRAYSHSAKIALDAANIITMSLCTIAEITCDYGFYGKLPSFIPENGGKILDTVYEDNVTVRISLPKDLTEKFNENLIDTSNGRYKIKVIDEEFSEI